MAGGLNVTVRQVASYPALTPATLSASDLVLLQQGGIGGPYASVDIGTLVANALSNGLGAGIGVTPPPNIMGLAASDLTTPFGGTYGWNWYRDQQGVARYWQPGVIGQWQMGGFSPNSLAFYLAPAGQPNAAVDQATWEVLFNLTFAGDLQLPLGTLTVARDPVSALEVATLGWVGRNTVTSFNNRVGALTLSAADIYGALGICPPDTIATQCSVDASICRAINDFIRTYPSVWSWMGRVGDVFLTVADMNFAAANNPAFMPPLTIPEPPQTVTDGEVVTASWVLAMLATWSGGGNPPFASEAWVINYVATNSVASFNGRMGQVTLMLADILAAGGAPINSPAFGGVPTAPTAAVGSSTSQIATTAFVMAAVAESTAGVASFNGRTGAVTLNSTDINNAGGALLASPNFTGLPTAPTPPALDSSTRLATTAFVTSAIAAAGGVTAFNGRTGSVIMTLADITNAGGAPLVSPAFQGTPLAPTPATGTDNTEIATTAFVNAAISAIGIGVTSFEGRTGAVTLQANDISAAGGLVNPNVALTGTPTAPTPTAGNSSTQIATTAFVNAALLGTVTTFNGRSGAVTLAAADISGAGGALLASPAFTGVPTAPTAAPGTTSTQLATTAFVAAAVSAQAANSVTSFNGRQGIVTLTTADITGAGGAPIASPAFTGTPTVPTASAGTATTQAASTAFVMAAIAASTAGVTSFNSRTGAVTLQTNDVSAVGGALLASPTLSGTPTAPTPAPGNNSTQIATTAFVANALLSSAVTSFNGRTGAVTLQASDLGASVGGPFLPTAGGTITPGPLTLSFSGGTTNFLTNGNVQFPGGQAIASAQTVNAISPSSITLPVASGWTGVIAWNAYWDGTVNRAYQAGPSAYMQLVSNSNPALVQLLLGQSSGAGVTLTNQAAIQFTAAGILYSGVAQGPAGINGAPNGPGNSALFGFTIYPSGTGAPAHGSWGAIALVTAGAENGYLIRSGWNPGATANVTSITCSSDTTTITASLNGNTNVTWPTTASDRRLKSEIKDAGDALSIVAGLPVHDVHYNPAHPEYTGPGQDWPFSLIADEVEAALPFAYVPPPEGGYAGLNPQHLVTTLWRAVQQLLARIEVLEAKLA
jgi:hypothetical protein